MNKQAAAHLEKAARSLIDCMVEMTEAEKLEPKKLAALQSAHPTMMEIETMLWTAVRAMNNSA
jgi:hypothetical protein